MRTARPIWQFTDGVVSKDDIASTIRSEVDCMRSGFEIRRSQVFEN